MDSVVDYYNVDGSLQYWTDSVNTSQDGYVLTPDDGEGPTEGVQISNNISFQDDECCTSFTLPDNLPEDSVIYFQSPGEFTLKKEESIKTGEIYLKGCDVVEMNGLDLNNVSVKIEDSKNIKMTHSHFGSSFPIRGSMVEFGGDTVGVELSYSIFDGAVLPGESSAISMGSDLSSNSYTEVPDKTIKNVKEDTPMATSLSVGLWITVIIVAAGAALFVKRANWRSILWPIKKIFLRSKKEAKKVEEVWETIE